MSDVSDPDYDGPIEYEHYDVPISALAAHGHVRLVFDEPGTINRYDLTREEAFELMAQIGAALRELPGDDDE